MRIVIVLLCIGMLISCEKKQPVVFHSGALRTMMSGNISKTIELDTLSLKKHLYALGAFEKLQGEV